LTATSAESPVSHKKTESSDNSTPQEQSPEKTKTIPTLELGAFELSQVTIRYEDQQTAKVFELKDLNIQTDHVQDGQSFHLQSKFTLISSGSNNNTLSVHNTLETDILLALSAKTLKLDNLSLNSLIKGFGLQDTAATLAGNAMIDLSGKNITLTGISLNSGKLSVQANATVSDFSNPTFKGNLLVPEFSLGNFLENHKLPQPLWEDDSALQQFEFSCDFAGDMKKIDVSDIKILLDGAHGNGSFVLIDPSHPAYDFKMHLDRLDLDRYATIVHKSETISTQNKTNGSVPKVANVKSTPSGKAASLQPLFPMELLRKLHFQLDLDVDSMKIKGAEMSHVELKASGKDGQLELKPFRAKLYEGTISAGINLDVRAKVPQLKVKNDIAHVQIGPLLSDMTGKEEVTGAAVLSLQLSTRGNSKEQLTRNANGMMNLALEDGVIKKLHILQVVRQAKA
ncbi:MAG TPA: AsmA family protein, partial [Desulfobacterales bacterium]|nr:AsmA family protein [Desulfobacterales bacterium]